MINHLERAHGVWFAMNGAGALVDALERLMRDQEIGIDLNTTVARITVAERRATGVDLEDGRHLPADIVVSNIDPMPVSAHKLPKAPVSRVAKQRQKTARLSMGFMCCISARGRPRPTWRITPSGSATAARRC